MAGGKKLVIVESPTKMKSIQGYLGDEYEVLSSVGHIRDLAKKEDIPADKKQAYGKYSIDVENGFDAYYVVSDRKTKTVAELKRALKERRQRRGRPRRRRPRHRDGRRHGRRQARQ
ncbi:hypothetical protein BO218_00005 [Microbacterium paludicola]|nr:toprim domain-containing protein [Microbacterium paludicola]APF35543.1 hypothetical protein BO218_00005 [Microbacterium paludicola]